MPVDVALRAAQRVPLRFVRVEAVFSTAAPRAGGGPGANAAASSAPCHGMHGHTHRLIRPREPCLQTDLVLVGRGEWRTEGGVRLRGWEREREGGGFMIRELFG